MNIQPQSLMSLLIEMKFDEQHLAFGTAFIVNSDRGPLLITNRHNVTGLNQNTGKCISANAGIPNNISIRHNATGVAGEWVFKTEQLLDDDKPRWIEHPQHGAEADFMALPLTDIDGVDVRAYDMQNPGPSIVIGPTEVISVVGFPFGRGGGLGLAIWATGFIASEPNLTEENLFYIDCRSRKGQSGSAVIAYRGTGNYTTEDGSIWNSGIPACRFLGIYSGRINDESDIGIVWKASVIRELVESINGQNLSNAPIHRYDVQTLN